MWSQFTFIVSVVIVIHIISVRILRSVVQIVIAWIIDCCGGSYVLIGMIECECIHTTFLCIELVCSYLRIH